MKKFTTPVMLITLSLTLIFTSGCQLLLFPFQMIFYLLGTMVTTFFSLLPVAARCLPLLMLLAQVQDDTDSGTSTENNAATTLVCQQIEAQQATITGQPLGDAQTILTSTAHDTAPDTQMLILSFDAWADPQQIASALQDQTRGKTIVSLEYKLVDGTSLFNDKLTFFSLLDMLKNRGVVFKGFGTMKPTVDRFYDNSQA